jgi:hypothetical protein
MGKEGKPKSINDQMPFYAIGCFVETVAFGRYTRIAGILDGLRVNDDQGRPLRFFSPVCVFVDVKCSSASPTPLRLATACSANRPLSKGESFWVSPASCIRF